jgi:hypothetical protein
MGLRIVETTLTQSDRRTHACDEADTQSAQRHARLLQESPQDMRPGDNEVSWKSLYVTSYDWCPVRVTVQRPKGESLGAHGLRDRSVLGEAGARACARGRGGGG